MNTTIHKFLPEDVMAFLDGELSPEQARAIAIHLEVCTECSAVAANFRGLSSQMISWRVVPVPTTLEQAAATPKLENIPRRRRLSRFDWAITAGSVVVGFLLLMAVAAPNLLRSRVAANESSAVGSLRTLNTAAATYRDTYGHFPFSLRRLGPPATGKANEEAADLVDPVLAAGRKSGYSFNYRFYPAFGGSPSGTYSVRADPLDSGSGVRHFSTDQSGVLFADGVELGGDVFAKRAKTDSDAAKVSHADELASESAPMIARSVVFKIEVKKMADAREELEQILARHRGYVAQLSAASEGNSQQTLATSLRVPADQLNECIAEIKRLGRVTEETQTGQEVTSQHRDLLSRLQNARTTESKLNDLIRQHTGKVSDVLEVEKESARVRGEIEQMDAEQKTLEHRVEFATIDLKLAEEYKAQLNTPAPSVLMQLRNAAVNGFRNAFESLLALVLFLAESGPSLLLWLALLSIPAWRLWRRYRRALSLGSLAGA